MYSFTINTDASFSEHHGGVGAWACWIKSTHYKIQESGLIEGPVPNSSIAEALAIEQALYLLDNLIDSQEFLRRERDLHGIKLYVNTDSMWVIQALRSNIKRSKYLDIAWRISALVDHYDVDIRHVKAHTNNTDARSWVNNWCDRAARRLVRKRIEELNGRRKKV